jgi:PPOX class probable F420-dependent enzyme
LAAAHDYWLATVGDGGRPHVMPVWGLWRDGAVWFSSGLRSRKARNLAADPRCTVTTDDAHDPVVVEGVAGRVADSGELRAFADAVDAKYGTSYGVEFYDPAVNGVWRVPPAKAIGLRQDDFSGSPTRWTFAG